MTAKLITTPSGEKLATLPAEEYEDLCDALAHVNAMADIARGATMVWRGMSRAFLAAQRRSLSGAPSAA